MGKPSPVCIGCVSTLKQFHIVMTVFGTRIVFQTPVVEAVLRSQGTAVLKEVSTATRVICAFHP